MHKKMRIQNNLKFYRIHSSIKISVSVFNTCMYNIMSDVGVLDKEIFAFRRRMLISGKMHVFVYSNDSLEITN